MWYFCCVKFTQTVFRIKTAHCVSFFVLDNSLGTLVAYN